MPDYRSTLMKAVDETGWHIISIENMTDWWAKELWTIESFSQPSCMLYFCFGIDPTPGYLGDSRKLTMSQIRVYDSDPSDTDSTPVFEADVKMKYLLEKLPHLYKLLETCEKD